VGALALPRWRVARAVCIAVSVVVLGIGALVLQAAYTGVTARGEIGFDASLYASIGHRWLETGLIYYPAQFLGPYTNSGTVMLYPPPTVLLFAAFSIVPAFVWWVVPLALIAWSMTWLRPPFWVWPLAALAASTTPVIVAILYGNTLLWTLALTCLATRWSAAGAVLLVLKPSDALFALPAMRGRAFWLCLAALVAGGLLTFGSWLTWLEALRNFQGSPFYSINAWPALATPWLLYAARRQAARRSEPVVVRASAGDAGTAAASA
jgi:hypothetical protein